MPIADSVMVDKEPIQTAFLTFSPTILEESPPRKTEYWEVYANRNNALLGSISWYPRWRQYVFNPKHATLFNSTCLREIAWFCSKRNGIHAKQLKEKK